MDALPATESTPRPFGEGWPEALHVVDADSPGSGLGAARIAAALAVAGGSSQRILFLGSDHARREAIATVAETGAPGGTLRFGPCPPLGDPTLSVRPLRRAIEAHEAECGRVERLVGWGTAVSLAVALAMPGRPRATVSTVGAIVDRRLRRLARLGTGPFACLSEEASRSFVAASPAFGPIAELPVPPAAWAPVGDRRAIRARWKVDDATLVIGLLGDDPRWCDLKHAIDAVGYAAAAGVRSLLVASPRSARVAPARPWTRALRAGIPSLGGGDPRFWITDEGLARPWSVAAGLDLAFIPGDGLATAGTAAFAGRVSVLDRILGRRLADADGADRPIPVPGSPLPFACAMAAGLPILSESSTAPRAECDAGVAILGDASDRVAGSRAVMTLADDRTSLASLTAAASRRLADRHGPDGLTRWRAFLSGI